MADYLLILVYVCLAGMLYQDLKYRKVHVVLPLCIFITCSYLTIEAVGPGQTIRIFILNSIFLVVTLVFLIIYMSIKSGYVSNPFQNYFGLGDLLFYLSVTPLFLLYNYVLFFIFSLVFTLALYYAIKRMMKQESIPLAGMASLFLIVVISFELVFNLSSITLIR